MAAVPLPMYGYMAPAADATTTTTTTTTTSPTSPSDLATAIATALSSVLDAQGREMVTYALLNKRHLSDVDVAAFVQSHPDDDVAKNALAAGEPLRKVALQSIDRDAFLVLQQAKAAAAFKAMHVLARRLQALFKTLSPTDPMYPFFQGLLADPEFRELLTFH